MRTVWSGLLLPAVLLGLGGQALLLLVLGGGNPDPRLLNPLLLLTILLLAAAVAGRGRTRWLDLRLLFIVAGLAVQVGALALTIGARDGLTPDAGAVLHCREAVEQASHRMESLLEGLDHSAGKVAGIFPSGLGSGAALFARAAEVAGLWPQDLVEDFPLKVVLWSKDQRLAWTPRAVPLAPPVVNSAVAGLEAMDRVLEPGNGRWYLRQAVLVKGGGIVELQAQLPETLAGTGGEAVGLKVVPPREAARLARTGNDRGRTFNLVDGDGEPVLWLESDLSPGDPSRRRNLSLLMLTGGWLLILIAMLASRKPTGKKLLLITSGAWFARDILARLDVAHRLANLDPSQVFPVPPASLLSLLDPAYFATPALGGWLASSADALLSSLVVLSTAIALWRTFGWPRLVGGGSTWRPGAGQGPGSALIFGLGTALVLAALEFLTGLMTANANARLVGTSIPLASASFWALHLALMAVSVAAIFILALLLTAWRRRPQRERAQGWSVTGLITAPAGVLVATLFVPGYTGTGRILAALLALAFWLLIPGLGRTTRLLRRLTLPALLMLVVIWNHTVLRDLDGRAERRWLENKAEAITTVDDDWTRFLLGSILEDMLGQDVALPPDAPADIWRDEPAWRLWKESALEDLGGACLVEVLNAGGGQESLMARGFLRDFQYEVSLRTARIDRDGQPPGEGDITFQTERRLYSGGEEDVLIGEAPRPAGRGWIRVEMPLRSWRVSTLQARLRPLADVDTRAYRPRVEAAGSVLLVRGDATGWRQAADNIFPDLGSADVVAALKSGQTRWGRIAAGGRRWLCLWQALPEASARFDGEGFLIGLQIPGLSWSLLDLSRLMLLNLVFFFLGRAVLWLVSVPAVGTLALRPGMRWRIGFQERFLGGYLLLGLFLLLVVGMSVDQAGYQSVRSEARNRTRQGLSVAVEQLRSLLVEQARSLAGSEYIADMLLGQLAGNRTAGPVELRQAMVFDGHGELLLDETLSNLDARQARALLNAGREAPLVIIRNRNDLFVGAVIPIDLTDILKAAAPTQGLDDQAIASDGFFLYRQRLDEDLLVGLADLVQGEATLSVGGRPLIASHPEDFFAGNQGRLVAAHMMAELMRHPGSPGIFAGSDRPFAFTGAMPLPAFETGGDRWLADVLPAVLALSFPDREREFTTRRTETILFLTGLANLILLTALALAGILGWSIFRPLQLLAEATRSLAAGDFQAPLPAPGHDEVGELTTAFGAMRTQLHTARESLAARERFLSLVLERVPVGVGVLDEAGLLVVLNPAGSRILAEFNPGCDPAVALQALRDQFLGAMTAGEGGEVRSAGERTVRGAVAPLELPAGRTDTMVVFEDITDFLVNKKLALSADLARQVAHEIKNPLTPIRLSAQLLGQAWQDQHERLDEIVPDTVQRILDQVDLLRRIASEFSLLGRPNQLDVEPRDLGNLVTEVAAAYASGRSAAGAEAGPPLVEISHVPVPKVLANTESLQKILGNLMQNSLDAAVPGAQARIDITWHWDDAGVALVWRDHGTGIPADVADHLFDPYFSTKTRGTGLGLAICRSLVDRMGGSITLANCEDGEGAVATLVLPRAQDPGTVGEDS